MGSILIRNTTLVQVRSGIEGRKPVKGSSMKELPILSPAWILLENGLIAGLGEMDSCPDRADEIIDGTGRFVFPTWCDPHTHIAFAGSRETEFVDKIRGASYEEIAAKGGGILNSALRLAKTSEDELFHSAFSRLDSMMALGTGAVEIKSGYGLSFDSELKMLRVIKRLKQAVNIPIRATFLGAHAIPADFRNNRSGYLSEIIDRMLPVIADEGLADYMDVFCDKGFFSAEETDQLLSAGERFGLKAKIHANELDYSGGIQVGVKHRAISVDHLECTGDEEIEVLLNSSTMPTLLPGTAFFLRIPYPPARKMIDSGLPIALATDFNPGSCPSGNFPFIISLACLYLKMLPEEAVQAATLNAAIAMELEDSLGTLEVGKRGSVWISKPMDNIAFLPYSFGHSVVDRVILPS